MTNIGRINKLKFLAILSLNLIALSVFIAYINPIKGYELSIYQSTPPVVFIFLIISIISGITIIFHQVYTIEYKNSNFWIFGFLILILSRISLLYLPFIRGYYTWRGDNLSQIGFVKDILFTGHFGSDNYYPIIHILLAEITSTMGVSVDLVVNHSTALFSILYVISIYLLASSIIPEKKGQLLSVAAIGGVLFNRYDLYLIPNGWSVLYFPLVLFFFFKSFKSWEYRLLLVITLILYPLFHPFSSVVLIIALLSVGFLRILIHMINHEKLSLNNTLYEFSITKVLIVIGILLPWILSMQNFVWNIRNLYISLITGQSPNVITQMIETLDKIDVLGIELLKLIIKTMGDDIIFLSFSIITVIILIKNYKTNKKLESYENLIILLGITFVIGFIYILYLFNIIPGLEWFAAERLLKYLALFTPIFVGYTFQQFFIRKKIFIVLLCILIIMAASTISILSLYPSPYDHKPNAGVTRMDMHGYEWLLTYKNENIGFTQIMSFRRFADAILGMEEGIRRYPQIPDHFNYPNYSTLGESYKEDRYAVITQMDKIIYDTVWKTVGRFNKEDFEKLGNDKNVDKIYTNRESDVWYIHGI